MKIKKSKNILFRIIDDEVIIINPVNSKCILLNSTGSYIWQLLQENKWLELDLIVDSLLDNFHVSKIKLRSDIKDFFNKLLEHQIVKIDKVDNA